MFDQYAKRKKKEIIQSRMDKILLDRVLVTPNDNPLTLLQLSEKFGVGRERVRQQEAKAIERLRCCIELRGVNYFWELVKNKKYGKIF